MADSSWATTESVWRMLPQEALGHWMPLWVIVLGGDEEEMPWKGNVVWHERQRRYKGVQFWKRTESGIWDSNGWISTSCVLLEETDETRYLLVSRPRQAASMVILVPLIGAQRRSTGGRICLWR